MLDDFRQNSAVMWLTLKQKGILFISLLVAFELVFVAALLMQLDKAEKDALYEASVKDIYVHTQAIARGFYTAHEKQWAYNNSLTPKAEADLHGTLDKILADLDYLKAHCRSTDQQKKLAELDDATRALIQKIYKWNEKIKKAPEMEQPLVVIDSNEDVRLPKRHVQDLAIEFLKAQQEEMNSLAPAQDAFQKNMQLIIGCGLVANIVLACGLSLFLTKDIADRLNVILRNSRALRAGGELAKEMRGTDEIILLDKSFHAMAKQIKEHERLRRSYIAVFREDLAAPLHDVLSNIDALKASPTDFKDAKAEKMLTMAQKNIKRLVGIVDDLTESNSIAPPEIKLAPDSVLVSDIVERSMDAVKAFAEEKGISVRSEFEESQFVADGDKLIQVMVNFLSNAVKFSPKGESVLLKGEPISTSDGQPMLKFSVIDRGRGIPEHARQSIFEKFQQVEAADGKRGTGTGLGLNICKQIVERHCGRIGVDSELGKGSTFWILVPTESRISPEYLANSSAGASVSMTAAALDKELR